MNECLLSIYSSNFPDMISFELHGDLGKTLCLMGN